MLFGHVLEYEILTFFLQGQWCYSPPDDPSGCLFLHAE